MFRSLSASPAIVVSCWVYANEETEIDFGQTFRLVSEVLHDNVKKYNLGNPEFVVEPGLCLVGNAGALISQVTHVKKSYRNFVGLDAVMNLLLPSVAVQSLPSYPH